MAANSTHDMLLVRSNDTWNGRRERIDIQTQNIDMQVGLLTRLHKRTALQHIVQIADESYLLAIILRSNRQASNPWLFMNQRRTNVLVRMLEIWAFTQLPVYLQAA